MTEEVIYINDPLGRKISIAKNLCCFQKIKLNSFDLLDDLFSVIKKPALMIEMARPVTEYLYFRSIGWDLSVLIHVKRIKHLLHAYKCRINPSDADIIDLLKNGKQII